MKRRIITLILGSLVLIAVAVSAYFRWDSAGVRDYYRAGSTGFRHDKVELEQRFKDVIQQASKRAEEEMSPDRGELGRIHQFDTILKRILKEDYGIEWRTTAEMNPDLNID